MMEYHNEKPHIMTSTIEEFWSFQRNSAEMANREFVEYMAQKIRFATPGQLEGALLCVRRELSNFLTPPERKYYLQTFIEPLIIDAIENPKDLQMKLF